MRSTSARTCSTPTRTGRPGTRWRASPARLETLADLPPAYVLTAGADPLRDEGEEYAKRLEQAGVAVTYRSFPGQFHGFFTMGKLLDQANVAVRDIAERAKR